MWKIANGRKCEIFKAKCHIKMTYLHVSSGISLPHRHTQRGTLTATHACFSIAAGVHYRLYSIFSSGLLLLLCCYLALTQMASDTFCAPTIWTSCSTGWQAQHNCRSSCEQTIDYSPRCMRK